MGQLLGWLFKRYCALVCLLIAKENPMALCLQTGAQLCIRVSTDNTDDPLTGCANVANVWTDYTCQVTAVAVAGGDIPIGETQTFCGTITSIGQPSAKTVTLSAVKDRSYFDVDSIFAFLQTQYEGRDCFWLEWTYCTGGTIDAPAAVAGDERYCALVLNTTCAITGGDAASSTPITKDFTLTVANTITITQVV